MSKRKRFTQFENEFRKGRFDPSKPDYQVSETPPTDATKKLEEKLEEIKARSRYERDAAIIAQQEARDDAKMVAFYVGRNVGNNSTIIQELGQNPVPSQGISNSYIPPSREVQYTRTNDGNSTANYTPTVKPQPRRNPVLIKPPTYPIKILFSIQKGDNYEFYIGGDRTIPELIFTLEYNSELDWNPFDDLYWIEITNTGKKKDDWIITYSYFDLESPYSDEFIPIEWGYYYQTIKIVKKIDGEITIITHQVPYDDPLKLLKYGCASTNFYQGSDYFDEFATSGAGTFIPPYETNILIDINYSSPEYIYPENPLDGYVPLKAYEWFENGKNTEEIMLIGAGETNESLITETKIKSVWDELGGIFDNSLIENRMGWHNVGIRFSPDSPYHLWDWDKNTEGDQDGIINRTYYGIAGLFWSDYGYNQKRNVYRSLVSGDSSVDNLLEISIEAGTSGISGGLEMALVLEEKQGFRAFHFINNESSIINEINASATTIGSSIELEGASITVNYVGKIRTVINGQESLYSGSFNVLSIPFIFIARSAYLDKRDWYDDLNNQRVFTVFNDSNKNYVTNGYNIGLVGNNNNCLFESFTTTFTDNTDRNNPLTTFESTQYLLFNGEQIEIDKQSMITENWLDSNGRLAGVGNFFYITDLINNKLCTQWFNTDIFTKNINDWVVYENIIDVTKDSETYGKMLPYTEKHAKVLSLKITEEDLPNTLWWSSSYYA